MQDKWIKIAEAATQLGYKTRTSACSTRGMVIWARLGIRIKKIGFRWYASVKDVSRVLSLRGAK